MKGRRTMKRITKMTKHATLIKENTKDKKIKNLCDGAIESEKILLTLFCKCRNYNYANYYGCNMCKYKKLCIEYVGKFPDYIKD